MLRFALKGTASTREIGLLALLTAIGLFLRLISISAWPLWGDEALTLTISENSIFNLLLVPIDPTPGLYYLLHKALIGPDASVAIVRSISLVAGTLSIPAIYAVARLAFGGREALVAAALLAASLPLIDYSQEARAYSLLVLLVLVSAAALLWWGRELHRHRPRHYPLWLFGAATILGFYTHLISIFWVGPALLMLVAVTRRAGSPQAHTGALICVATILLAAVPEMLRLGFRAQMIGTGFWLENYDFADFLRTAGNSLLPSELWRNLDPRFTGILLVSILTLIVAVLIGRRDAVRSWARSNPFAPLVLIALLVSPLMIWLFGFVVQPIFMPRTILIGIPGFFLLLALVSRFLAPAYAVLIVAAYAVALLISGTVRDKEDWRTAVALLERESRPGDSLAVCASWKWPALRHAATGELPISVFLPLHDGRFVLAEQRLGTNPHWTRDFSSGYDQEDKSVGASALRPTRVWWVRSECTAAEMRLIESWAGSPSWRRRLVTDQTHPQNRIEVLLGTTRSR